MISFGAIVSEGSFLKSQCGITDLGVILAEGSTTSSVLRQLKSHGGFVFQ